MQFIFTMYKFIHIKTFFFKREKNQAASKLIIFENFPFRNC